MTLKSFDKHQKAIQLCICCKMSWFPNEIVW